MATIEQPSCRAADKKDHMIKESRIYTQEVFAILNHKTFQIHSILLYINALNAVVKINASNNCDEKTTELVATL